MQAGKLPRNLENLSGNPPKKFTNKNNRRSIILIERFTQSTETQLDAIANLVSALVSNPRSVVANCDAKVAGSNREVNS